MEHSYIEEQQLIDRYLMHQLPAGEARRFEEHYLDCQDCLGQLEVAEKLQRGLKRAVAEDATRIATAQHLGRLAWLGRLLRSPRAGLLVMAFLLVALLPAGLLVRNQRQLGRQLDHAHSTLAALRQHQPLAAAVPDRVYEPQINTALFSLSAERGTALGDLEPSHIVRLSAAPEWLVLSLELGLVEYDSYQVTLWRGEQQAWQRQGLEPNYLDSLVLSLHSSWLSAGDYVVRVEAGDATPVAHFSFRVLIAR